LIRLTEAREILKPALKGGAHNNVQPIIIANKLLRIF
jgi:hypothetical protein